ncbi:MAG: YitT family protein [Lachnospiraceae bacterium]|nr:YitT family protein [Lachnospiraceae bacterium]
MKNITMDKKLVWKRIVENIKEYLYIIFGTFIMSIAVLMSFDATEVVVGGVTGLAIIFKNLFGIPMWVINAGVNLPLFIIGFKVLDKQVFVRTLVANLCLTLFLAVIPVYNILTGDLLVDIILGSVLMGGGLGFVFRAYASSGGTDLMASLVNHKIKYFSVPKIMAVIDGIIVFMGIGVFGLSKGIYALIAIFIVTRVSDSIVEGPGRAKLLYIISSSPDDISNYIMNVIGRGATRVEVTGAFTKNKKNMLMCVVSSREMVKIKQKTYQIDANAMCFVGDIREAFGEGFTSFKG